MFTGLVEKLGRVEAVTEENSGKTLTLSWPGLGQSAEPLALGESVAVNGTCLTAAGRPAPDELAFDLMPETL